MSSILQGSKSKSIVLIFCSIALSLVILEALLQFLSYVVVAAHTDNRTIQGNDYVILTMGESTTALGPDPWPQQLERRLHEYYPNRSIKVVNGALVGTNTSILIRNLKEQLVQLKPKLIISMMGVNDYLLTAQKDSLFIPRQDFLPGSRPLWIERFITVRMGHIGYLFVRQMVSNWYDLNISHDVRYLVEKGRENRSIGNYESATQYVYRSLALDHANPDAYIELARIFEAMNRPHDAIPLLHDALATVRHPDALYTELGRVYGRYGAYEDSVAMFQQALVLNPRNADAYIGYGGIARWRGNDVSKAEILYKAAYTADPNNKESLFSLAMLFQETNRTDQAENMYRKILAAGHDGNLYKPKNMLNLTKER